MRMILAPAKKMREDTDTLPPLGLPMFLEQTRQLKQALQAMTPQQLQALWRCSEAITRENVERLGAMELERGLTPAILAYEGIQYRYMAPGVFETEQMDYVQEHVRILSGFYGMLRPFDGVRPYRLEMQARLAVGNHRDLYSFWGERLGQALGAETDLVVDLASKEYSRCVLPHLPPCVKVVECVFGELRGEKVVEKGTLCKMARGRMVRWMAEERVHRAEELQAFRELGYEFSTRHSNGGRLVFIRKTGR